jgi:hypothetical protein
MTFCCYYIVGEKNLLEPLINYLNYFFYFGFDFADLHLKYFCVFCEFAQFHFTYSIRRINSVSFYITGKCAQFHFRNLGNMHRQNLLKDLLICLIPHILRKKAHSFVSHIPPEYTQTLLSMGFSLWLPLTQSIFSLKSFTGPFLYLLEGQQSCFIKIYNGYIHLP